MLSLVFIGNSLATASSKQWHLELDWHLELLFGLWGAGGGFPETSGILIELCWLLGHQTSEAQNSSAAC